MNKEEIKPMPSNVDAEQALLGCILKGGEREQEIAMAWIREDEAFYSFDNKLIWESMRDLYKDGVEIDNITLSNKVKEVNGDAKIYYITGLTETVPSTARVEN